jgi:LemA protein
MLLIALVAAGVLVLLALVGTYNKLVRLRVTSQNAWSDVDVQLKRRYDLVPNLVETVKGYAGHERSTLEAVTAARSGAQAAQSGTLADRAAAEGQLTAAIHSLVATAEAYPQLQASGGFRDLQQQLAKIEDSIQNARRYYNAVVRELNAKVMQFPSNLVAGAFGVQPREFFEAAEPERAVPKVAF